MFFPAMSFWDEQIVPKDRILSGISLSGWLALVMAEGKWIVTLLASDNQLQRRAEICFHICTHAHINMHTHTRTYIHAHITMHFFLMHSYFLHMCLCKYLECSKNKYLYKNLNTSLLLIFTHIYLSISLLLYQYTSIKIYVGFIYKYTLKMI